ncbi:MAG: hypothetical protein U5K56_15695 [Halioglobus sp.]|nr:hypothetical protein [Halioglobus sp.]
MSMFLHWRGSARLFALSLCLICPFIYAGEAECEWADPLLRCAPGSSAVPQAPPSARAASGGDAGARLQLIVDGIAGPNELLESILTIHSRHEKAVDWKGGIRLYGAGAAGGRAIEYSGALADNWWRGMINVVQAASPRGRYSADFSRAAASGNVSHIYYRLDGANGAGANGLDTGFFRICEQYSDRLLWYLGPGGRGRPRGGDPPAGRAVHRRGAGFAPRLAAAGVHGLDGQRLG